MRCLLVVAHPLDHSLCASLARVVKNRLEALGHEVVVENLYARAFDPRLSPAERESYYGAPYVQTGVTDEVARLLAAEALVLVFPTWWGGFPAILKGWFDRVWGPGIAYDHGRNYGPIEPRLKNLGRCLAITTLGSPWWADYLVFGRPVYRTLKWGLLTACAPKCRFQMLSLYRAERLSPANVAAYVSRIEATLAAWQ